ncbi:hypothetical protein BDF19DRAFT_455692 [Syncephalis fuscata]|nr:hypothetical protein BDF19DRAFT_455692 [Syncephalis fuscata]
MFTNNSNIMQIAAVVLSLNCLLIAQTIGMISLLHMIEAVIRYVLLFYSTVVFSDILM